ncbi:hypothetical protein [Paenibacillus pseudetheri]|uniref:Lipoprotein n=1 Tax=Paenibacillus pseudetheri TaxID=2897682 RepID=A0ABM9BDY1_9BACL|nr:hypothetical protein [Paenibacillus pseudetheri]CAH1057017.1 hypothetical protein PAECIP111894_03172 [Paenibacillus pseudetheri]
MRKIILNALIILIFIFVTGCTSNADTVDTPLYSGKSLSVGVVGETPEIREDHIHFTSISFEELEDYSKLSSNYDAVVIMKEHLQEADDNKYVKVYTHAGVPFFFIESTKSYMPFVLEDVSYEHSSLTNFNNDMYAIGYLQTGESSKNWGYGLYNDIVNDPNVNDAYSCMFTTIESIEDGTSKEK